MENYLKPLYTNLEIAIIVARCHTMDQLTEVGIIFSDLHLDYEILDIRFFEKMAHKRVKSIL